jgi:hypothetical protein
MSRGSNRFARISLPITTPASFAAALARATRRYHTQGTAEDTAEPDLKSLAGASLAEHGIEELLMRDRGTEGRL